MRALKAIRKYIPWWIPVLFAGAAEILALALFLGVVILWAAIWMRVM